MTKHKSLGQVFTPDWIVSEILDSVGYRGKTILGKLIMEPASGDGAFLLEIVKRYISESLKAGYPNEKIVSNIETCIYGLELDTLEYEKSKQRLNELVSLMLDKEIAINWNIVNCNTLENYREYINMFDFVVGNPPYIRIHNLNHETRNFLKKEFSFTNGTIDIYLSFFELGFKLLKKDGILGYITPNSFLHNSSYKSFREFLKYTRALRSLTDFKANPIFSGFSTYTAITIIQFNHHEECFDYNELINGKISKIAKIKHADLNSSDWSFSNRIDNDFLVSLKDNEYREIGDYYNVQYGFATLRDKIYIGDIQPINTDTVLFNGHLIETKILKKIVKGSTYRGNESEIKYILFPYYLKESRYIRIEECRLESEYPLAYEYLKGLKDVLLSRDLDKGALWYEFGRSQGIQSSHSEKVVCSTIMKDVVYFYILPADIMVYSGIFVTKKSSTIGWDTLTEALSSDIFKKYIQLTGKDMSGGYKSITSKQIKHFKLSSHIIESLDDQQTIIRMCFD